MGDFFNLDNKFFQGLSNVVDCVILSVLWEFCCIPMATTFFLAWQSASVFGWILCWLTSFLAGPATTALYYAVNKVIRHVTASQKECFMRKCSTLCLWIRYVCSTLRNIVL